MSTNNITKIFLVLNSGSSSEKFSLYEGEDEVCSLYFEGIEEGGKKKFICTITRADGSTELVDKKWDSLDVAFKEAKAIFEKTGFKCERVLSVSNFRSGTLKKLFGTKNLVKMEDKAQKA